MLVIAFSDLHAGMTADYDAFHKFLDRVQVVKPDLLIGVGDIIELLWMSFDDVMAWSPSQYAIMHLQEVAHKVPTKLLPGNHDLGLNDYIDHLHPIRPWVSESYTLDGVTYIHGHQFDPVYRGTWAWISRLPFFNRIAPQVGRWMYGTPYLLKSQGKDNSYSKLAGAIEANAVLQGGKIVMGHTHSECIRFRRNGWLANCGDRIDSGSALIISDGYPDWFE